MDRAQEHLSAAAPTPVDDRRTRSDDTRSSSSALTARSSLRLDPFEIRIFVAVGLVLALTKLPSLVQLTYSPDDHFHTSDRFTTTWMALGFVGQGRFGQAALYAFLEQLGLDPVLSSAPLALVAIGAWSLSAVLLTRLWALRGHTVPVVLVGSLIFSHPYFVDHWWFRFMPIFGATATLSALAGLWWAQTGRPSWWMGALGVCFSLSVFQVAFNQCLVVIIVGMLLDLVRVRDAVWGSMLDRWRRPGVVLALGTGAYLVAMRSIVRLFGIVLEDRVQSFGLVNAPERLRQVGDLFFRVYVDDPVYAAPVLQALVLAIVITAAILVVIRLGRDRLSPARALIGMSLMGIAAVSVVGLMIAVVPWWPAGRTLTAMGFFVGGTFALAYVLAGRRSRVGLTAIGMLVLAGFAGVGARLIADQVRLNERDRALGVRLLDRLAARPDFGSLSTFIVVKHPWRYPDIKVSQELGRSTWGYAWAQADLMREISGKNLRLPTADERQDAQRACEAAPKWPATDSVLIRNGVGIACF